MVSAPIVKTVALSLLCFVHAFALHAQKSGKNDDDLARRANELFEQGQFAKAYPLYSQLVSLKPNDASYNFKFGTCALYAGVPKESALKHLNFAEKKGCDDVRLWFYLGKAYHLNYEFENAANAYRKYLNRLDPKTKDVLPAQRNLQMCKQGAKLLSNIKDVIVLEKTEAAEDDFFRYYNLEEIGGRVLRTPDELLTKYDKKMGLVSTMHYPGNALTIYFTSYGKDGRHGKDIFRADILPGGSYSTPERLPDGINTDEDEDFAFMHPDGKSFFFASRGHNSMGGYDIFSSSYNRMSDTFGKPVNLDFAINTPDDDLFYVVDSLKQVAYFASRRNSAQGTLHVYKVLVQSLPVNLTFIAGDYKPEAPGADVRAKVTITDELTGKPIFETEANATAGGYLLELPKAGVYRIDVQPRGGAVRHSGVFTVPVYDESVALAQELRIINENGIEKLIITNSFDVPLNVNIAELAATSLRRRSALEVNATDERIQAANEAAEPRKTLRDDLAEDDLVEFAGFAKGRSLNSVIDEITAKVEASDKLAVVLDQQAAAHVSAASEERTRAAKKMAEAQSMMEKVDQNNDEAYRRTLDQYKTIIAKADDATTRALNLLESASAMSAAAVELKERTSEQRGAVVQLKTSLSDGALNDALTVLTAFHNEFSKPEDLQNPAIFNLNEDREKHQQALNALAGRMESLADEKKQLELRNNQLRREREAASRKNLQIQLDLELEATAEQLNNLEIETNEIRAKIKNTEKAYASKIAQQELVSEAAGKEQAATGKRYDPKLAENVRQQLDADLNRLAVLTIDDDQPSGRISDPSQRRELDLASMPVIAARLHASGVELKSLYSQQDAYRQALDALNDRSVAPEVKRIALKELQIKEAEQRLRSLALIENANLSTEERQWRNREAQETTDWINLLRAELPAPTDLPNGASVHDALKSRYPSYGAAQTPETGGDLEAAKNRLALAGQIDRELAREAQQLRVNLLQADDAAEAQAINTEIQLIEAMRKSTAGDLEANKLRIAWENDRKAVFEADENFTERTNRQIELTETYIEGIDLLLDKADRDGDRSETKRLQELRSSASQRLTDLKSERELVLSVAAVDEPTRLQTDASSPDVKQQPNQSDNVATSERIESLVKSIDETDDESERDRMLAEISALRTPKTASIRLPDVVTFEDFDTADARTAMAVFTESMSDNVTFMTASGKVASHNQLIEDVEDELNGEESRSMIRKLDRRREELYTQRAGAYKELSLAAAKSNQITYDSRRQTIRTTWEASSLNADSRRTIGTHLALEQRKAESAFEQAATLRAKASKDKDVIRSGDLYMEALTAEIYAIELQNRLVNLLTYTPQLANLTPEQITAFLEGADLNSLVNAAANTGTLASSNNEPRWASSQEAASEIRSNAQVVSTTPSISNEMSPSNRLDEDATTTAVESDREALASNEQAGSNSQEAETAGSLSSAENVTELRAEARIRELRSSTSLPETAPVFDLPEATVAVEDSDAVVRGMLRDRNAIIESRAAVVRDIRSLSERMERIEAAMVQSRSEAEQDGLAEELRMLYRNAEVRYAELAEAEERLEVLNTAIETRSAEVRDMRSADEALSTNDEPTSVDVAPRTEVRIADAARAESVESGRVTERSKSSIKTSKSDYYFALPEVLIESMFSFTESAVYSNARPIPIDIVMPEGLVFKVQVGAFRNPIPQDHFNRFAPLSGERLQNGITRYTAGAFIGFAEADAAKNSIRSMGYSDAFVVAYYNGKRISLAEARAVTAEAETPLALRYSNAADVAARSRDAAPSTLAVDGELRPLTTVQPETQTPRSPATLANNASSQPSIVLPEFAESWSNRKGVWLTVQIGVYSKPVSLADLYNVSDVMAEVLDQGMVRYTTGRFNELSAASAAKDRARAVGISDAFITAYIDGKRVPLTEAAARLANGEGPVAPRSSASDAVTYMVKIGGFDGQVPGATARALLMLESKWGVKQSTQGDQTIYTTRKLETRGEAERALNEFKDMGAERLSIEDIRR